MKKKKTIHDWITNFIIGIIGCLYAIIKLRINVVHVGRSLWRFIKNPVQSFEQFARAFKAFISYCQFDAITLTFFMILVAGTIFILIIFWIWNKIFAPFITHFTLKKCSVCGNRIEKDAGLIYVTEGDNMKFAPYCKKHFMKKMDEMLKTYHGTILFMHQYGSNRSGRYVFYDPDDMVKDNYTELQVAEIKSLFDKIPLEETNSLDGCRIVNFSAKSADLELDDKTLFSKGVENVPLTPVTTDEFEKQLDSFIKYLSKKDRSLTIQKPYASQRGVYLAIPW